MDKIRGALDVELTVEEVTTINALIERDTVKETTRTEYDNYICPVCNKYVSRTDTFCKHCGQRIVYRKEEE